MRTKFTNLCTNGDTIKIAGNATVKANPHAFNHINNKPGIIPTLKVVITSDIIQDMINAIKNEKTMR